MQKFCIISVNHCKKLSWSLLLVLKGLFELIVLFYVREIIMAFVGKLLKILKEDKEIHVEEFMVKQLKLVKENTYIRETKATEH